jgi:Flp pilus assembly protein TadG
MPRKLRDNRGQAAVEVAIVLPVLLLIMLAIFQFGIVFKEYLSLTDAVREGARKAAVARHLDKPDEYVKAEVVKAGADLDGFTVEMVDVTSAWQRGEDVVVFASYPYEISLLGMVVREGEMKSETTERVE